MGCSNSKQDLLQEETSFARPRSGVDDASDGITQEAHSPAQRGGRRALQPLTEDEEERLTRERAPTAGAVVASPEGVMGSQGTVLLWAVPVDEAARDGDGVELFPFLSLVREHVVEEHGHAELARLVRQGLTSDDPAERKCGMLALCESVHTAEQWCSVDALYAYLYHEDMAKAIEATVDPATRAQCEAMMAAKQVPFTFVQGVAYKLYLKGAQHSAAANVICTVASLAQWEAVQADYDRLCGAALPDVLAADMPREAYYRAHAAFTAKGIPFTPAEAVVHHLEQAFAAPEEGDAAPSEAAQDGETEEAAPLGLVDEDGLTQRDAAALTQLAKVGSFAMWEETLRLWTAGHAGATLLAELEVALSPMAYGKCHAAFHARNIAFTLAETVAARLAAALAVPKADVAKEGVLRTLLLLRSDAEWVDAQEAYLGLDGAITLSQALAEALPISFLEDCRRALAERGIAFSLSHAVALQFYDILVAEKEKEKEEEEEEKEEREDSAAPGEGEEPHRSLDEPALQHALGLVTTFLEWEEVLEAFRAAAGDGLDLLSLLRSELPSPLFDACHAAMAAKGIAFTRDEITAARLYRVVTHDAASEMVGDDLCSEDEDALPTPAQDVRALIETVHTRAAWSSVQAAFSKLSPLAPLVDVLSECLTPEEFEECGAILAERDIPFTPAQAAAAALFAALNGPCEQEDIVADVLKHLAELESTAQWRDVQTAFEAAYSRDLLQMFEAVLTPAELKDASALFEGKGLSLYPPCRAIAALLHTALDLEPRPERRRRGGPAPTGGVDLPVIYEQLGKVASLAEWVEVQGTYAALYLRALLPTLQDELPAGAFDECHELFAARGLPFTAVEGIAAGIRLALDPPDGAPPQPGSVYDELQGVLSPRVWEDVQDAYTAAYSAPLAATLLADLPDGTLAMCLELMKARDIPFTPAEARALELHKALGKIGTDVEAVLEQMAKVASVEEWEDLQREYSETFGGDLLTLIHDEVPGTGVQQCRALLKAKAIPFTVAEAIAVKLHAGLTCVPVDADLVLTQCERVESAAQWAAVQAEYLEAYGRDLVAAMKEHMAEEEVAAAVSVLDAKDISYTAAYDVAKRLHLTVAQHEAEEEEEAEGAPDSAAQEDAIAAALGDVESYPQWVDVQGEYRALAGAALLDDLRSILSADGMRRCDSLFKDAGVPFTSAQAAAVKLHDAFADGSQAGVLAELERLPSAAEWEAAKGAYREYYGTTLRAALEAALGGAGAAACRAVLRAKALPYTDDEIAAAGLRTLLDAAADAGSLLAAVDAAVASQAQWASVQDAFLGGELFTALRARLGDRLRAQFTAKGIHLNDAHAIACDVEAALDAAGGDAVKEIERVASTSQWKDVEAWYAAAKDAPLAASLRALLAPEAYLAAGDALAAKGITMTKAHGVAHTLAQRIEEGGFGTADAGKIHEALRQVTDADDWAHVSILFRHAAARDPAPALASALGRIPLTVAQYLMVEKDVVLVSDAQRVANGVYTALERDAGRKQDEVVSDGDAAFESAALAELTTVDDLALWDGIVAAYPAMYNRDLLTHIKSAMTEADYTKCSAAFAANSLPFTPTDFRARRCYLALTHSPCDTAAVAAELAAVEDEAEWEAVLTRYREVHGGDLVWLVKAECSAELRAEIEAGFQARGVAFEQRAVELKEEKEETETGTESDWEVEDPFKHVKSPVAMPGSPNAMGYNYDQVRHRVHVGEP